MSIIFELEPAWEKILTEELQKTYMHKLAEFVQKEYSSQSVYPPKHLIFNAFWKTPYEKVKVVIVGQDPYHGIGQAHGLSFSVPKGVPIPPSLKNIYKEIHSDLGLDRPPHGCLLSWAEQGVLLLNATLTVRDGQPMSHHGLGWEQFTDAVIAKLAEREDSLVFVLWGKSAQDKCRNLMGQSRHLVLHAPHPSPFSAARGFLGCRHFSKINEYLTKCGKPPVDWKISC